MLHLYAGLLNIHHDWRVLVLSVLEATALATITARNAAQGDGEDDANHSANNSADIWFTAILFQVTTAAERFPPMLMVSVAPSRTYFRREGGALTFMALRLFLSQKRSHEIIIGIRACVRTGRIFVTRIAALVVPCTVCVNWLVSSRASRGLGAWGKAVVGNACAMRFPAHAF